LGGACAKATMPTARHSERKTSKKVLMERTPLRFRK
jgi:hypothetical protein